MFRVCYLILFISLCSTPIYAQRAVKYNDTIEIKKGCNYIHPKIRFEGSSAGAAKINKRLEEINNSYLPDSADFDGICNKTVYHEYDCFITYDSNNILSIQISFMYLSDEMIRWGRTFNSYNFNTLTGEELKWQDIIKAEVKPKADTFITYKLAATHGQDIPFDAMDTMNAFEQIRMPDLVYNFTKEGITIEIYGATYVQGIQYTTLSYKELEPFVRKDGIMSDFYN